MDKKTFSVRISESLMKQLRHLAIDSNRPLGSLLDEAIQEYLKKQDSRPQAPKSKKP